MLRFSAKKPSVRRGWVPQPLRRAGRPRPYDFASCFALSFYMSQDFLEDRGVRDLYGSRDTTRTAFRTGLIENGEIWMEMIQSRNLTTHTYNESIAVQIVEAILNTYFAEFQALQIILEGLKQEGSA